VFVGHQWATFASIGDAAPGPHFDRMARGPPIEVDQAGAITVADVLIAQLSLTDLTRSKIVPGHNSRMRLFWMPLVIVVFFGVDACKDGRNTNQAMSLARWTGEYITRGVNDLLRPFRM
jgi:hypothetical protein